MAHRLCFDGGDKFEYRESVDLRPDLPLKFYI